MSSHPGWPGSEPRALPARVGAFGQSALGTGEGRRAGHSGLRRRAGTPSGGHSPLERRKGAGEFRKPVDSAP